MYNGYEDIKYYHSEFNNNNRRISETVFLFFLCFYLFDRVNQVNHWILVIE